MRQRLKANPLAAAMLVSLCLHVTVFAAIQVGQQLNLQPKPLSENLQKLMDARAEAERQQADAEPEIRLTFVEVSPSQATTEVPENAKHYSAYNARAANPDPKESDIPRIDGTQEQIVKTEDSIPVPAKTPEPPPVPEPKVQPAPPAPPEPPPASRPRETLSAGNLALAKPAEKPRPEALKPPPEPADPIDPPKVPRERPRTLAAARPPDVAIAGEKMKHDGGAKRLSLQSSFDTRAMPFGSYDAAIIAAIQRRWYALLDERDFASDRVGRVVLEFRLHWDGSVTQMNCAETSVGDFLSLLCQRAVLDPSPFEPWPTEMRRMIGSTHRDVRFTFYYN